MYGILSTFLSPGFIRCCITRYGHSNCLCRYAPAARLIGVKSTHELSMHLVMRISLAGFLNMPPTPRQNGLAYKRNEYIVLIAPFTQSSEFAESWLCQTEAQNTALFSPEAVIVLYWNMRSYCGIIKHKNLTSVNIIHFLTTLVLI
jgi:hypothetical protein